MSNLQEILHDIQRFDRISLNHMFEFHIKETNKNMEKKTPGY